MELLEEAIEDRVQDMKRHVEVDMAASAQTVCAGIVAGLYACRKTSSDGALGWARRLPAEHAGFIVQEFLGLSRYKLTNAERGRYIESLVGCARMGGHVSEGFVRAIQMQRYVKCVGARPPEGEWPSGMPQTCQQARPLGHFTPLFATTYMRGSILFTRSNPDFNQ